MATQDLTLSCSPSGSIPASRRHSPYQHYPQPQGRWFRLLRLLPASGTPSCTLECVEVGHTSLQYQALSYVWGTDSPSDDLVCNGQLLKVGRNLNSALIAIREKDEEKILWVDAICINQQDVQERYQQVTMMGTIYMNATCVLIWVGEDETNDAYECFNLIRETNKVLIQMLSLHGEVDRIPKLSAVAGSLRGNAKEWDRVKRLMDRKWFTRVWVLQEVGLARTGVILNGKASMSWSELV